MAKRKRKRKETILDIAPCELCGIRTGDFNSIYSFQSPKSSPDCGDWVCWMCEEKLQNETPQWGR